MQRLSSCGPGVVWCRTGNYSQADERVNFGRKSFEFSERLEGKKREKRRKMAGGGRPQNWTSDRPRSVRPDWLSSCGFVELFLRNVNPLSKHGLWLRSPNPPRPQAAQQEHWITVWLRFMKHGGWSPAIRGGKIEPVARNVSNLPSIYISLAGEGLVKESLLENLRSYLFF